ncbi:uncharacterized protein LOC127869215 isoform X2 [Dreissena polymorpha]|uniref:uncharacterized protein LOC127869215 isoform X2 n=1 Tax=Dreissena polymorpha TaxID=45954 RepID=UPI002264A688|nr:uncharacterized protein LOC127869215 isoform X2 [Dreissena polymorpha]
MSNQLITEHTAKIQGLADRSNTYQLLLHRYEQKDKENEEKLSATIKRMIIVLDEVKALHVKVDSLQARTSKEEVSPMAAITLPRTLESRLTIHVENVESEEEVSRRLDSSAAEIINNERPRTRNIVLRNYLSSAFQDIQKDGNKVINHKNKCLQLHIESQSIRSWIKLCEDFFSGSLARAFQPVQRYLKTYEGWENLTFKFELDEEHFMHCAKSSVDYLKSILNAMENDVSAADSFVMAACEIPSIEKGADEDDARNCFACLKSKLNAEAGHFCKDCNQLYCTSCVSKHDDFFQRHKILWKFDKDKRNVASAPISDHNLEIYHRTTKSRSEVSLEAFKQECASGESFELGKCDVHKSQDVMSFCAEDGLLCCNICNSTIHRDCKDIEELPKVAKGVHTLAEFSTLPSRLQESLSFLDREMFELSEKEKLIEDNADAVKTNIQYCRDEIVGIVYKLQQQLFEAVELLKSSITNDIASPKTQCVHYYNQLKSLYSVVETDAVDETTAFIGLTKGRALLLRIRMLLKDIDGRYRRCIVFQHDTDLHKMLSKMQNFGAVKSVEHIFAVTEKSTVQMPIDIRNCDITAIFELPCGDIVLADAANSNLKLLNKSFHNLAVCTLPDIPLDMCAIGDAEIAVVTAGKVYFYFLKDGSLRSEKSIKVRKQSSGISYFAGHLYVATISTLIKYSIDGKQAKLLYKDTEAGGKVTISRCAISREGQFIYVTGPDCAGLLVLDIVGNKLTFVKNHDMVSPRGLHVAPGGQVFLCGTGSNMVLQLDREQNRLVKVADGNNGLWSPQCVVLLNGKSLLIIGQEATNSILVLRVS